MQGRGRDGRALDLKTIAKHKTRKAWFGEVGQAEVEAAAAEGLLLLCARELVAPSRAADGQEPDSLLSEVELLGAFPLCNLPEELQLIVAAHVAAPRDRAALCIAVPPLGRRAIEEIKAYQVPLVSLGFRVLSGGVLSEADVRTFVRKFAPSEATHPPLALNEYTQLNAMAAPDARVRCVAQRNGLEWRLESGALLRCWKPYPGFFFNDRTANWGAWGMHHYEGVVGAERLVSVEFDDGEVLEFRGHRGYELLWAQFMPTALLPWFRRRRLRGGVGWGSILQCSVVNYN